MRFKDQRYTKQMTLPNDIKRKQTYNLQVHFFLENFLTCTQYPRQFLGVLFRSLSSLCVSTLHIMQVTDGFISLPSLNHFTDELFGHILQEKFYAFDIVRVFKKIVCQRYL